MAEQWQVADRVLDVGVGEVGFVEEADILGWGGLEGLK